MRIAPMVLAATAGLLCACASGPLETQYGKTGVRLEEWTEIRAAIRKVTLSPVICCSRDVESPGRGPVTVWTQDGKTYLASKIHGKWHLEPVVVVI